jgi:hypothetical protein
MKSTLIHVLTPLIASASVLLSAPALASPGDPIPKFDLTDLTGKQHTYQQYEGRMLLLFFLGHN